MSMQACDLLLSPPENGSPAQVNAALLQGGITKDLAPLGNAVHRNEHGLTQTRTYAAAGYTIHHTEGWQQQPDGALLLTLAINGQPGTPGNTPAPGNEPAAISQGGSTRGPQASGIAFSFTLPVKGEWQRLCVPSLRYTAPGEDAPHCRYEYMEDRLPAPLVYAYGGGRALSFEKLTPARTTDVPQREKGQARYLHRTACASLGYQKQNDVLSLCSHWPYAEGDKSAWMDAAETPIEAYWPLDGAAFNHSMQFRLHAFGATGYSEGLFAAWAALRERLAANGEAPPQLPFTTRQSMGYRLASLCECYREFEGGGAGFFFHFDPLKGYGSLPSGFGSGFNTIPHTSYVHILEYGFTGRQLNTALLCAEAHGGEWDSRAERVTDFFLQNCLTENGWMYSLYDLDTGAPFYSFGDETAPKLHYISHGTDKGNYLRTMAEPAFDLLRLYRHFAQKGKPHAHWLDGSLRFANFLLQVQNADGSWHRGYRPDGTPADMGLTNGMTETEADKAMKASTAIPLAYLCHAAKTAQTAGRDGGVYLAAAKRAAAYTLANSAKAEQYRGGTMDNPNLVDKEAAQYVMAGMWAMYEACGCAEYLAAAKTAACQFVTWNYIWNAPLQPGSWLYTQNFRTKGLGAINSVWGGGVVDIYSLFHIRELYLIGKACGVPAFCTLAGDIAAASQQILSHPQNSMGFADTGMQPEGFAICCQGIDEGMIQKGDIWGTLGWIYSAGIDGIARYLEAAEPPQ